ncbi:MAG: hypothetical protein HY360_25445 [Verrucomicrobia bacterium]|nr:hypothetical protein [Verrucomicrobiota bacterium]
MAILEAPASDIEKLTGTKTMPMFIGDNRRKQEFLDLLKQMNGVKRTEFPTLVAADGEKMEANAQKPMRCPEFHFDSISKSFTESSTMKGVGIRWSCLPTIQNDKVSFDFDLEITDFERYVDFPPSQTDDDKTKGTVIKQPVFNSRTVTTSLCLLSGQTAVLGGLVQKNASRKDEKSEKSVPFTFWILVTAEIFDKKK